MRKTTAHPGTELTMTDPVNITVNHAKKFVAAGRSSF